LFTISPSCVADTYTGGSLCFLSTLAKHALGDRNPPAFDPRRRSADTTSGIHGQYPLADTNTRPLDPSIRVHLPPRLGIAHPDTPARSPGLLCVTGQRTRSKILQARFSQRDRASARRVPPGVAAGEGPCRRVFYYTVHEAHPTSLSTYRSPHLHPHPTLCYLLNKTVAFPVSLSER
jgi:hypothetical protein